MVKIAWDIGIVIRRSALHRCGVAQSAVDAMVRAFGMIDRDDALLSLGPLSGKPDIESLEMWLATLGLACPDDYFVHQTRVPEWFQPCAQLRPCAVEKPDPEALAAMLERCARATRGPWRAFIEGRDHESGSTFIMTGSPTSRGPDMEMSGASDHDVEFVAHARQDLPRLLAYLTGNFVAAKGSRTKR